MKAILNGVTIEARNFGFRSKTWSCLVLGGAGALNFLITGHFWPAAAKWPINLAFTGWLIISTLTVILCVISEARRKPNKPDAIQQIIIKAAQAENEHVAPVT